MNRLVYRIGKKKSILDSHWIGDYYPEHKKLKALSNKRTDNPISKWTMNLNSFQWNKER